MRSRHYRCGRNQLLRFDPDPIPIVSLSNLHSNSSRFTTTRADCERDDDEKFLHVITSEIELSAMRAVAQGLADEGFHEFARVVTREADFRADVNTTIRGYRRLLEDAAMRELLDS